MQKVFKIPSPAYIVKFVHKEMWEGKTSPYFIDERSLLGKHVYSILIDKRTQSGDVCSDYESELEILLSNTLAKRSPTLLKLSSLVSYLDGLMKSQMKVWVNAQMQMGSNRYQAVISFLRYYDIETDTLIDRSYQYIKRYHHTPFRIATKRQLDL